MSAWLDAFQRLSSEQKERLTVWIHVNELISDVLELPFEAWVERYVTPCMERPMDYDFVEPILGDFAGLGIHGTFSRTPDASTRDVPRVPVRARNNLGRFSPTLQEALTGMLDRGEPVSIQPAAPDVVLLQKLLPAEKPLVKLRKSEFRKLVIARLGDEVTFSIDGQPIVRLDAGTLAQLLSKPLV